jgi:predicted helicase
LPRLPLIRPWSFGRVVESGKRLLALHVGYEEAAEYPLGWEEQEPFTWRVEKLRRTKDKRGVVINQSLTLTGVPEECDAYRLGNKSALDWVIDQYQVKRDKRSGLESDPNEWRGADGKQGGEYVARLVCQVVQVSMQTVEEVKQLAEVDIETLAEEG